jgi:hypothetical protein
MLQEKINIWDRTLGLRFSALVPKIYYDNFEEGFLEQIEKSILKVGMLQEKYKKFEADNFEDIKKANLEIEKVSNELLKIVYCLNKADNDIWKFPTFDEWLNKFDKPNLFDFNWFVELVIRLEENYTADQEEEEKSSKKKLKMS